MPTGHFVLRKAENHFKRETPRRYEAMSIDWLEWEASQLGHRIQHHRKKNKEKNIGKYPVDWFCKQINTVYQFDGCICHGHDCALTRKHGGTNSVNCKPFTDLHSNAINRDHYLKTKGYALKIMTECEWLALKKTNPKIRQFIKTRARPCDDKLKMSEEQNLNAVVNDHIYGDLEVGIKVPDHLRQ